MLHVHILIIVAFVYSFLCLAVATASQITHTAVFSAGSTSAEGAMLVHTSENKVASSSIVLTSSATAQHVNNLTLQNDTASVKAQLATANSQFLGPYPFTQQALGQVDGQPNMGTQCRPDSVLPPNQSFKVLLNELEYHIETDVGNALLPPNLTAENVIVANQAVLSPTDSLDDWDMKTNSVNNINHAYVTTYNYSGVHTLNDAVISAGATMNTQTHDITCQSIILLGSSTLTADDIKLSIGCRVTSNINMNGFNLTNIPLLVVPSDKTLTINNNAGVNRVLVDSAGNGIGTWQEWENLSVLSTSGSATQDLPVWSGTTSLTGSEFKWTGSNLSNDSASVSLPGSNALAALGPTSVTGNVDVSSNRLTSANLQITTGSGTSDQVWTNTGGGGVGSWADLPTGVGISSAGTNTALVRWNTTSSLENASTWTSVGETLSHINGLLSLTTLGTDDVTAGGSITASTGDITAANGEAKAGTLSSATVTTTGNITGQSLTGNEVKAVDVQGNAIQGSNGITAGTDIVASASDIVSTIGNVTAFTAVQAGTTVTGATGLIATTGNITATTGNLVTNNSVQALTMTLVQATSANAIISGNGSGVSSWVSNTDVVFGGTANNLRKGASGGTLTNSSLTDNGSTLTIAQDVLISGFNMTMNDNQAVKFGSGDDLTLQTDGVDTYFINQTGDMHITLERPVFTRLIVNKLGTATSATSWEMKNLAGTTGMQIRGDGVWLSGLNTEGVLTSDASGNGTWEVPMCAQLFDRFVVASPGLACGRETSVTVYNAGTPLPSATMFLTEDVTVQSSLVVSQDTHIYIAEGKTLTWAAPFPSGITVTFSGPGTFEATATQYLTSGSNIVFRNGVIVDLSTTLNVRGTWKFQNATLLAATISCGLPSPPDTFFYLDNTAVTGSVTISLNNAYIYMQDVTGGLLTVQALNSSSDNFAYGRNCVLGSIPSGVTYMHQYNMINCTFASGVGSLSSISLAESWTFQKCIFQGAMTINPINFKLNFQGCVFEAVFSWSATNFHNCVITDSVFESTASFNIPSAYLVCNKCRFASTLSVSSNANSRLMLNTCEFSGAVTVTGDVGVFFSNNTCFSTVGVATTLNNSIGVQLVQNQFHGIVTIDYNTANSGALLCYGNYFNANVNLNNFDVSSKGCFTSNICQAVNKTGTATTSFVSANRLGSSSGFTAAEIPAGYNI